MEIANLAGFNQAGAPGDHARVDRQGRHRHAKQDEQAESGGGERTAGLPQASGPGGDSVHQHLHHRSLDVVTVNIGYIR